MPETDTNPKISESRYFPLKIELEIAYQRSSYYQGTYNLSCSATHEQNDLLRRGFSYPHDYYFQNSCELILYPLDQSKMAFRISSLPLQKNHSRFLITSTLDFQSSVFPSYEEMQKHKNSLRDLEISFLQQESGLALLTKSLKDTYAPKEKLRRVMTLSPEAGQKLDFLNVSDVKLQKSKKDFQTLEDRINLSHLNVQEVSEEEASSELLLEVFRIALQERSDSTFIDAMQRRDFQKRAVSQGEHGESLDIKGNDSQEDSWENLDIKSNDSQEDSWENLDIKRNDSQEESSESLDIKSNDSEEDSSESLCIQSNVFQGASEALLDKKSAFSDDMEWFSDENNLDFLEESKEILDKDTSNLLKLSNITQKDRDAIMKVMARYLSEFDIAVSEWLRILDYLCIVLQGDMKNFIKLLKMPALKRLSSFHSMDRAGTTSLMNACRNGNLSQVRALIAMARLLPQIDIKQYCDKSMVSGANALLLAADKGYAQIVELLLFAGADPNVRNKLGQTGLIVAAMNGNHTMVKIFLKDRRTDLNCMDFRYGRTALISALSQKHREVAFSLIKSNVDLAPQGNGRNQALHMAVQSGFIDLVEEILKRISLEEINAMDEDENTALHHALLMPERYSNIVLMLLEKGASPYIGREKDTNALFVAVSLHYRSVILPIMEKMSFDAINSLNRSDMTVLDRALYIQDYEMLVILLRGGAYRVGMHKPALRSWYVSKVLSLSVREGLKDTVVKLLEDMSVIEQINSQDKSYHSPLMHAIRNEYPEIALCLLKKGAKINMGPGKNTFLWAARLGFNDVLIEMLKRRDEQGAKLDASDTHGLTALHHAANSGHTSTVKLLIGFSKIRKINLIDMKNNQKQTALDLACTKEQKEIIAILKNENPKSQRKHFVR